MPLRTVAVVLALAVLSGCGLLRSSFAQPDVAVASIRLQPNEGFYQPVLIDLMVYNPGRRPLELAGLHYRVRLEGHELVRGTSREPLEVPAGATVRYTVPAGFNLLSGLGFLRDLLARPRERLRYELEATLEPAGIYWQPIEVRRADFIPVPSQLFEDSLR